jgi:hypothetical protein
MTNPSVSINYLYSQDKRFVRLITLIVEFVVADILMIAWNLSLFDRLAIQPKTKKLIQALAESKLNQALDYLFNYFVGKGRLSIYLSI